LARIEQSAVEQSAVEQSAVERTAVERTGVRETSIARWHDTDHPGIDLGHARVRAAYMA
jgi:hypothetical protein